MNERDRPVIGVAFPKPDYLKSLERAGAAPFVLKPERDALPGALDNVHGILLTGGADVDPARYGEAQRHNTVEVDADRDEYEIDLTRYALDRDLPNFTAQENRGRHLFMTPVAEGGAGCSACHLPPTFALAADSHSNGLDPGETRLFKAPSLRSVGLTGPYMHDGRFATLAEVVEFYDHGVQVGPALDPRLRNGSGPQRLDLGTEDRAALVAFLVTLNDPALVADERFSDPFRR